jgi:hypothetical protein
MPRQRSGIGYTHKRGTGRNKMSCKLSIDVCHSFPRGKVDRMSTSCADGLSTTPKDDGASLPVPTFVQEGAIVEQALSSSSSSCTKKVLLMEPSNDALSPGHNAHSNLVHKK